MTTQTADIEAVIGRLEKVERENRNLKAAGLTALLGVVLAGIWLGFVALSRSHPEKIVAKEIEAERFGVTDASGYRRAFFGISGDNAEKCSLLLEGDCTLALRDSSGQFQASMTTDKESARLMLGEQRSKGSDIIMETRKDSASLSFWDSFGRERAALSLHNDKDSTGLRLWDLNGQLRCGLWLPEGGPRLTFLDPKGEPRCTLSLPAEYGGRLVFFDPDGKRVRSLTER
jgi:hypothetical protein